MSPSQRLMRTRHSANLGFLLALFWIWGEKEESVAKLSISEIIRRVVGEKINIPISRDCLLIYNFQRSHCCAENVMLGVIQLYTFVKTH